MFDFHDPPIPESCEVCQFTSEEDFDTRRLEHTLTRFAAGIFSEDLEAAGRSALRMSSFVQYGIGFPGPTTKIHPRHWHWALMQLDVWVSPDEPPSSLVSRRSPGA